ncbi:MAG: ribose-phosphate diphosphokinase [Halobaculum sp.]
MLVPGSASQSLTATLAAETGRRLATPEFDRFADGELRAAVPDFDGDRAVIVAATTSNDALVELLQLQDAVREAGAERVETVLPYVGYARQDRAFRDGEPVSARAVGRAVATGTDRVVLVSPHETSVADYYPVPTAVVDAAPRLADPLGELRDPVFLAPDEGAVAVAESVRDAYGTGVVDHFRKHRDRETGEVRIDPGEVDATGRDVVITDDIVATGSTVAEAVGALATHDPHRIVAACVHPMLAGNAHSKLAASGVDRVVGTDTVERAVSTVSVAPLLADVV